MLKQLFNYTTGIIFLSLIIFCIILWLYFSNNKFMDLIIEKSYTYTALISFLFSAFSGYGLTRLAVFDKLDDLKEEDAIKIHKQASSFRKYFEDILHFSIASGLIIFILGIIATSFPIIEILSIDLNPKVFFGIFFSFIISIIFFLLTITKKLFNSIHQLKNKVFTLSQIENKRKEILTKMYDQAEKNPFNEMDFHLKKYNQTTNNNSL